MKRKSVNTVRALLIMGILLGAINMTACSKSEIQDDVVIIAESEETSSSNDDNIKEKTIKDSNITVGKRDTLGEEEFRQMLKNEEFQKRMIMTMNRMRMERLTKPIHIGKLF